MNALKFHFAPVRYLKTILWMLLWLLPWGDWFENFIWARLLISVAIFIVPGAQLYWALFGERQGIFISIIYGFSVSLLLIGILTLIGRIAHLSFNMIALVFFLIGFVLSLKRYDSAIKQDTGALNRFILHGLEYVPALIASLLVAIITTRRILSEDDEIYIAYLTHLLHSSSLNFKEIIFGFNEWAPIRFWIMSIPASQALLAKLSRIPGLVLSAGYYEPILVLLAILAYYELAKIVGFSQRAAALAVTLQLTFLTLLSSYLHPGAPFFNQLANDKATAAFILAPLFIHSAYRFLCAPSKSNTILCALTGISLSFAHPVIFLYAAIIVGLMGLFRISREHFKTLILLGSMIGFTLIPQILIRYSPAGSGNIYQIDEILKSDGIQNVIKIWGSNRFYGFNPAILEMTIPFQEKLPLGDLSLHYVWLIIPISAAVLSAGQLRKSAAAQYILAASILCLAAWNPLSGPLLAEFVTPWMLERTTWLFPFGICAVFILKQLSVMIRIPDRSRFELAFTSMLSLFCLTLIAAYMVEQKLPDPAGFNNRAKRYAAFSQIGSALDGENASNFIMIASDGLNDFIPSFTARGKVISFRLSDPTYSYFLAPAEHGQRDADRQAILSKTVDIHTRVELCKKYDIKYLLIRKGEYQNIASLVETYPDVFEKTLTINNFMLFTVKLDRLNQ